ncbi:MAG: hypothetical protein MPJ78_09575 [Hyphomicrobiaceae bacterium]|nr:hypothetical protein [Hyphomicrobiaceae bacterium]
MTAKNKKQKLERLAGILDVYGADASRWPDAERKELRSLIKRDRQARLLHREARALARVMDAAPSMRASSDLKAEIVSAAARCGDREARVVPIEAGQRPHKADTRPDGMTTFWPAVGLAASFALGVYLGVSGVGGTALDNAFQLAALNNGAEEIGYTELWLDENGGGEAEGLL